MLKMGILLFISMWAMFPVHVASGSTLELRCDGTTYVYENGFSRNKPLEMNDTRIIKIDLTTGAFETNTFLGPRFSIVDIDDNFFEAILFHKLAIKGTYISEEKVFINRYTGEIFSLYFLTSGG